MMLNDEIVDRPAAIPHSFPMASHAGSSARSAKPSFYDDPLVVFHALVNGRIETPLARTVLPNERIGQLPQPLRTLETSALPI